MYKYIGVDEKTSVQTRILNNDLSLREFPRNLKSDAKTKKIFRFCNLPHEIAAETEGMLYTIILFLYETWQTSNIKIEYIPTMLYYYTRSIITIILFLYKTW